MPLRLPTVEFMTANLAGKVAAPHAVAGADVIPWRPAQGFTSSSKQVRFPPTPWPRSRVAGVWWYHGALAPEPYSTDNRGMQITYCYLDDDPVATAQRLGNNCASAGRPVTPRDCWLPHSARSYRLTGRVTCPEMVRPNESAGHAILIFELGG